MKIKSIIRRSKNQTRVLLEDGYELCLDSETNPSVGDEVEIPSFDSSLEIRPLLNTDPEPQFLHQ